MTNDNPTCRSMYISRSVFSFVTIADATLIRWQKPKSQTDMWLPYIRKSTLSPLIYIENGTFHRFITAAEAPLRCPFTIFANSTSICSHCFPRLTDQRLLLSAIPDICQPKIGKSSLAADSTVIALVFKISMSVYYRLSIGRLRIFR